MHVIPPQAADLSFTNTCAHPHTDTHTHHGNAMMYKNKHTHTQRKKKERERDSAYFKCIEFKCLCIIQYICDVRDAIKTIIT